MNSPTFRARVAFLIIALLGTGIPRAVAGVPIPPYLPFPTAVRTALRNMTSASGFVVDHRQRAEFYRKLPKPVEKKKPTDADRLEQYRRELQNQNDFLATQRKAAVPLSDERRQSLSAILSDETNYDHSAFSIRSDDDRYAVDVRSGETALTVLLCRNLVTVLTSGEQSNGLLNAQGTERLSAWLQTIKKQ